MSNSSPPIKGPGSETGSEGDLTFNDLFLGTAPAPAADPPPVPEAPASSPPAAVEPRGFVATPRVVKPNGYGPATVALGATLQAAPQFQARAQEEVDFGLRLAAEVRAADPDLTAEAYERRVERQTLGGPATLTLKAPDKVQEIKRRWRTVQWIAFGMLLFGLMVIAFVTVWRAQH